MSATYYNFVPKHQEIFIEKNHINVIGVYLSSMKKDSLYKLFMAEMEDYETEIVEELHTKLIREATRYTPKKKYGSLKDFLLDEDCL